MFAAREFILRFRKNLSAFSSAERGLAALEFALILPLLIALVLGTFEITRYTMIGRQVANMVANIAQVTAAKDGPITRADLEFLENAARAIPSIVRDAGATGLGFRDQSQISVASVVFKPRKLNCVREGCAFVAQVVATYGGVARRACGELYSTPDSSSYDRASLPQSVFGPGSIVVVDAEYVYRPIFGSAILPASLLTVRRSAFVSPRYVDYVEMTPPGGNLFICS